MADIATVFNEIAAAVAESQQAAGEQVAESLKYKVSVPVQYVTGPRGGQRVIRSKPGEPPRKETGALQASIESQTIEVGEQIATGVSVTAPYAATLQESLNRPITDDELDTAEKLFLDAAVAAIQG